jgi:hypothetical protein
MLPAGARAHRHPLRTDGPTFLFRFSFAFSLWKERRIEIARSGHRQSGPK